MLAIIHSSRFSYKNKIGEFTNIDIKYLVNNVRNNTISEIPAKKCLNTLHEIKEYQIKLTRKIQDLEEYWNSEDYGDEEWKFRYFKLKLAYFSNVSDKNLYKQIFDHTLEILANKLIKTTNKEKNQIIINNINKNKEKLYEEDKTYCFYDYVIQPNSRPVNLIQAINLNETKFN